MSAPLVGSPLCEHAYPSLRARELRASPSDQGPGRLWVGASAPLRTFSGVRLIIARCSIEYSGRLSTHLPEAVRLLVFKGDGSVLVHSDSGGYKPQNWMTPPTLIEEGHGMIVVRKRGA